MAVRVTDALKNAQDAAMVLGSDRLVLTFSSRAGLRAFVKAIESDVGMGAGGLGLLRDTMTYDGITMRVAP